MRSSVNQTERELAAFNIAWSYSLLGDHEQAFAALSNALDVASPSPLLAALHFEIAVRIRRKDTSELARRVLLSGGEHAPPNSWRLVGRTFVHARCWSEAVQAFERAGLGELRVAATVEAASLNDYAVGLAHLGRSNEASAVLERALQRFANDPRIEATLRALQRQRADEVTAVEADLFQLAARQMKPTAMSLPEAA